MTGFRSLFVDNGSDYDDVVVYDDTYVDLGTIYPGMGYEGRMIKKMRPQEEIDREQAETESRRRAIMIGYGLVQDDGFEMLLTYPNELFDSFVVQEEAKLARARTLAQTGDDLVNCTPQPAIKSVGRVVCSGNTGKATGGILAADTVGDARPEVVSEMDDSAIIYSTSIPPTRCDAVETLSVVSDKSAVTADNGAKVYDTLPVHMGTISEAKARIDYYGMYSAGLCSWNEACDAANTMALSYGWPLEEEVDSFGAGYATFHNLDLHYCPYVVEAVLDGDELFCGAVMSLVHEREALLMSGGYSDNGGGATLGSHLCSTTGLVGDTLVETGGGNSLTKGMSTGTATLDKILEGMDVDDIVSDQEVVEAEKRDISDPEFIASAMTDGKLVGSDVTSVVWNYANLNDKDGLAWVNVGCNDSISTDIPVALQVSAEAELMCHKRVTDLVNVKAEMLVGTAPAPVMISGSEVVGALSDVAELELVGMVAAAEFGPAGIVADGAIISVTDLVAEALGGEAGNGLSEAASNVISDEGYIVNFVKTRAGVIANGLMMGTIVGLMGIQHHNAEAEKHKNRLDDEKREREKAAGDKPLPDDAPEELANMKRLIDVLSKAGLTEYTDLVVNSLAVMPQRVMDVLGVVRSEAYAIVLRATQESDYINNELVQGLMLLDDITPGERWWLLSRGVPANNLAGKHLVSAIACDKTWTPNPMIVGERISKKETNGMPYLFEVMYLIAGGGNLRCVDINKFNIAASGIPYIICESQKKRWLLEMRAFAIDACHQLSWTIVTKNGVTRVTNLPVVIDSCTGAVMFVDVSLADASADGNVPHSRVAWGTTQGVLNAGSLLKAASNVVSVVEHTRRTEHVGWLCNMVASKDASGAGQTGVPTSECLPSLPTHHTARRMALAVVDSVVTEAPTNTLNKMCMDIAPQDNAGKCVLDTSVGASMPRDDSASRRLGAILEVAQPARAGHDVRYGVW